MSEYDSSSEGSEEGEKQEQYFRVFQQDFYLSVDFFFMSGFTSVDLRLEIKHQRIACEVK